MRLLIGILGIVLIISAVFLIRIPDQGSQSIVYNGMLITEKVSSYPVSAEVIEKDGKTIGVALHEDALDFGVLSVGMTARKEMNLNTIEGPVKVKAWPEGNISSFISFGRNGFALDGDGTLEVKFSAEKTGNYDGTIHISSSAYNYRWMDWLNPLL